MNAIVAVDQFHGELEQQKAQLATVLPEHMPVERFIRAAIIAVQMNPGILDADRQSLFTSLQRCAADGLVPDNREAALVEFNTKQGNNWIKKIQYMPMVDGVLKRARQSGEISVITARAVYQNDTFDYWVDEDGEHLNYRPNYAGDRGAMVMVFAMAKMKSGDVIVEPMSMEDINKVRAASKTGDKGPWRDWFERMALKSVLHRLARRLPNSSEIMEMLDRGNFMYDFDGARDVTPPKSRPQSIEDLGEYPQEEFDRNFPAWEKAVLSGKANAEFIASKVETKGKLTEAQRNKLVSVEQKAANAAQEGEQQ